MSEREELMQLIRNEYDPRPNLGNADYPGFEWNDGAGRIADAIIADKTLLLRKHADEIAALRASSPAQEPVTTEPVGLSFQKRATNWLMECFSMEICQDTIERNHRFLEEALELVQSLGCTKSEAHQLVDYVFDRDQGEVNQEVGGVMVTLAALCFAADKDMHAAGEIELARVWTVIDKIRAKQVSKPKHSPLPAIPAPPQPGRKAIIEECAKVAESFRRQMLPGDDRILIRKIEDAIRTLTGEPK